MTGAACDGVEDVAWDAGEEIMMVCPKCGRLDCRCAQWRIRRRR